MSEGDIPKDVRSAARILEVIGILPLAMGIVVVTCIPFWTLDRTGVLLALILGPVLVVKGVLFLLAARGLRRRRMYGRILGIALGFLCCLAFPVGTMVGVIIVMKLLNPETAGWFSRRGCGLTQEIATESCGSADA